MARNKADKKLWIGMGISLIFLFLLFRKIDFHKLVSALSEMNPRYLAASLAFTFCSYCFPRGALAILADATKESGHAKSLFRDHYRVYGQQYLTCATG